MDRLIHRSGVLEAPDSDAIEAVLQSATTGGMLRKVLFEEEEELLAKGEITHKIGFVAGNGAAMIPVVVPYEKYRWGRAVAEIACKLNASKIIQIGERV